MTRFAQSVSEMRSSEIRDMMSLASKPGIISFAGGMPDNRLLPVKELDDIYSKLTDEEKQKGLQYGPTNGLPGLRSELKKYLRDKGLPVDENELLITTGATQAINIMTKAFINPGDTIITENPCFIAATSSFKAHQANIVSIPSGENGIDVELLESKLNSMDEMPKFVYITPNFHNPSGALCPLDVKLRLIELLKGKDIILLEDDCYSDLAFNPEGNDDLQTIKSINPQDIDVCYIGSFSKILGPGLRLGWLLVPKYIYEKCELIKQPIDACSSSLSQVIAEKFLSTGMVKDYLKRVVPNYEERCEAMASLLTENLPEGASFIKPQGGFYMWITLPENIDTTNVVKKAIDRGAVFVIGKTFDPHGLKNNTMRLSFCNTSVEDIEKGVPAIIDCIKECM